MSLLVFGRMDTLAANFLKSSSEPTYSFASKSLARITELSIKGSILCLVSADETNLSTSYAIDSNSYFI